MFLRWLMVPAVNANARRKPDQPMAPASMLAKEGMIEAGCVGARAHSLNARLSPRKHDMTLERA